MVFVIHNLHPNKSNFSDPANGKLKVSRHNCLADKIIIFAMNDSRGLDTSYFFLPQ